MIGSSRNLRVWGYPGAADLRLGYDGLAGLVANKLGSDPLSGDCFLFTNRARTRAKVLVWDGSGLWVCAKRLEGGRFAWPQAGEGCNRVPMRGEELTMLLSGIDLRQTNERKWFRRGAAA